MNWQDEGFILSKRKFRENAIILEVFTNQFGKVNGIVYGGTSRKIKNYLQLTNKIFIFYNSKNENKIGYFKTELVEAIAPKYFDNKNKILCLNSSTRTRNKYFFASGFHNLISNDNYFQKKISFIACLSSGNFIYFYT